MIGVWAMLTIGWVAFFLGAVFLAMGKPVMAYCLYFIAAGAFAGAVTLKWLESR